MPQFDVQGFLRAITAERINSLTSVPAIYWYAINQPNFKDLDVSHVRLYRAQLAVRPGRWGRTLAPKTLLESHRAILCFLPWARREGYRTDDRTLELIAPRVPDKEPTVYHIAQIRQVLAGHDVDRMDRSRCGAGATPTHGAAVPDTAAKGRKRHGLERVRAPRRAARSAT